MVPNALCPPEPSHQPPHPPKRERQQGGSEDVTMCRGQRVAPEGLKVGGKVVTGVPPWEGAPSCPLHRGPWSWAGILRHLGMGAGGQGPVPGQPLGTCMSPEGSGPSGSTALLLALPGLHALARALPRACG